MEDQPRATSAWKKMREYTLVREWSRSRSAAQRRDFSARTVPGTMNAAGRSFYADNCRVPLQDDNDSERPWRRPDADLTTINDERMSRSRAAGRSHTWTIPRYRDLYGRPRDRNGQILFRAGDTSERASGRDITCPRVRTRGGVTIIFSLEIEATYDALASSCVVHVWTSVGQMEKGGEITHASTRERIIFASRMWIRWHDRITMRAYGECTLYD